ncbi:MAG: sulfatase-like hydrolase/transferase [Phycisphaeraceae bacterium]
MTAVHRSSSTPPNFLFILSDQHRADWLGCAGRVPIRTPQIDALAARGLRFTRAHCASPLCGPSRACLAAGVEYEQCGVPNHDFNFPADRTTYYRLLRDAGYRVGALGKLDLHKSTGDWGLDGRQHLHTWGFTDGQESAGGWDGITFGNGQPLDPYMLHLQQRGLITEHIADFHRRHNYEGTFPTPLPDDAYQDSWIGGHALEQIDALGPDQPWHLVVNFTGPHEPMDVTADMHRWYRDPPVDLPPPSNAPATEHDQEVRRNYAAKIEIIDRWIGRLLERVAARGQMERTVVVYASDHGEMLGDRGRWAKSRPWWQSVMIPLVFAGPGVQRGVCNDPVSLIDVGATMLDLAGVKPAPAMTSRSLRPALQGGAGPRPQVRSGLGCWRMVSDRHYKLVAGFDPQMSGGFAHLPFDPAAAPPMLFDVAADPAEQRNIAAESAPVVKRMMALLTGAQGSGVI